MGKMNKLWGFLRPLGKEKANGEIKLVKSKYTFGRSEGK